MYTHWCDDCTVMKEQHLRLCEMARDAIRAKRFKESGVYLDSAMMICNQYIAHLEKELRENIGH